MNPTSAVLIAVATELANQAKTNVPKLNDGEEVQREWYEDGIYYRLTMLDGVSFCYQYNFRQRKSRLVESDS